MLKILGLGGKAFEHGANAFTVIGGCLGLFAIANPETVATYLQRIDEDVSIIAESIPLWPLIGEIKFDFSPPTYAGVSLVVSNPKNLVVNDFSVGINIPLGGEQVRVDLDGPSLLPPNEEIVFSRNIIREPWFRLLEEQQSSEVELCLAGRIEGDEKTFYEGRLYRAFVAEGEMHLLERDFSIGGGDACQFGA